MTRALTAVMCLAVAACATGDETTNLRTTAAPHPLPRVEHPAGPDGPVVTRWHVAMVELDLAREERQRAARDRTPTASVRPQASGAVLIPPQHIERASGGCGGWRSLVASYFRLGDVDRACRILMCESGGDPNAVSPSGRHHGLMQIAGGTFDPEGNIAHAAQMAYTTRNGWDHWTCK